MPALEAKAQVVGRRAASDNGRVFRDGAQVRGIGLATLGVLVVALAIILIPATSTWPRTVTAVAGLGALWAALQILGERRYGRDFKLGLWLAITWLLLIIVVAALANHLPIDGYNKTKPGAALARPGLSFSQPLGRDSFARSNLSRVIFGARASLVIALLAVSLGLLVGSLLGLLAGYLGGVADALINIYANATLAFPPLVLLLGVVAVFHSSIWTLSLSLAFLSVPGYARIMRAQAVSLRQREFVLAARAMGATHRRIMLREILPNAVVPVASYSFIIAAVTIIAEGSISYLGLGIPPPQPSWGGMIADGAVKLKTAPHVVFVPATVMFLTVLSFNRVGDAVRKRTLGERNDIA